MPHDGNGTDSFTSTTRYTSQTFIVSSNVCHHVKIYRSWLIFLAHALCTRIPKIHGLFLINSAYVRFCKRNKTLGIRSHKTSALYVAELTIELIEIIKAFGNVYLSFNDAVIFLWHSEYKHLECVKLFKQVPWKSNGHSFY